MGTIIITVDGNDLDFIERSLTVVEDEDWWKDLCQKLINVNPKIWKVPIVNYDTKNLQESLETVITKEDASKLIDCLPCGESGYAALVRIEFIPAIKEVLLGE